MINQIMDLVIAYPSFQLNTIIDPEQANINNQQIVQKINFVAKEFNKLTLAGTSGASKITILPFTDVTAQNVQTALEQIMAFIKAYITSNNISVADLYAKIGLNTADVTAIKAKNVEQDGRLAVNEAKNTAQDVRLTNIEALNTAQDVRLTSVETKNTAQDTRLSAIEPVTTNNTTRIVALEAKDVEFESRLSFAETADGLNEAIVQDIDIRTTNTDNALVALQTEFDGYKSVNVNAELLEARTSPSYGTFGTAGARVNFAETKLGEVIANVGDKTTLLTSIKTSIVSAINSLMTLATDAIDGLMSKTDKAKLDGIATNANNYTHPTTAGNVHIPTGGAVGNYVKYSSSGVGAWATPTKTDVGLGSVINYGIATTAEAQAGTSDAKYMTPFRVVEQLRERGLWDACKTITDVHLVTNNGSYMGSGVTNAPDTGWWLYKVISHNSLWIEVEATPFTDSNPLLRKKIKYKLNNVWGGWQDARASGGDIVGKVFQFEALSIVGNGAEQLLKSYTNAKGGMLRFSVMDTSSWFFGMRVVVDGVTVINATDNGMIQQVFTHFTTSGNQSAQTLDLPFNSSVAIYVIYQPTANFKTAIKYYLNP